MTRTSAGRGARYPLPARPRRILVRARTGLLLAVLGCTACTSMAPPPGPLQTAPHHAAALDSRAPLPQIKRAFLQGRQLVLEYRVNGTTRQAQVSVEPPVGAPFLPAAKRRPVRVLKPVASGAPHDGPAQGVPIPVRDPAAWLAFLHGALEELTPVAAAAGASVDILKEDELFLYRSADGALVSVPMLYKPAGIGVEHTYSFEDLLQVMLRELPAGAAPATRVLFETGDARAWGYPFVYMDSGADLILFLQDQPAPARAPAGAAGAGTVRLFLQTVFGHVRGLFSQPVSSVLRL
ncbi:MAG: hypothetical protein PVI50_01635, partial [Gammaproteobacteria bacterium]